MMRRNGVLFLHPTHFSRDVPHVGRSEEQVCILLSKPKNPSFHIWQLNDIAHKPIELFKHGPVVGTVKSEPRVYHFRRSKSAVKRLGTGYARGVQVTRTKGKGRSHVKKYSVDKVDLRDVFASNATADGKKTLSNRINCVIKQKPFEGKFRFSSARGKGEKISGLNTLGRADAEEHIMELIRTRLPRELYTNVLVHLNYDHVKCLVDSDERFARNMARERYRMDTAKFADLPSLLPALQKEAAKEMRFSQNDDLWMVSLDPADYWNGVAKRVLVKPGVYTWLTASAITSREFSPLRSQCTTCTDMLVNLQTAMARHQSDTLKGKSTMKFFVREGTDMSEPVNTASTDRSLDGSDNSYEVHMWRDNLDNQWLQDVHMDGETLSDAEYYIFKHFKTLFFKDPVKFFGTKKKLVPIDTGIMALMCDTDGEIVGYLVEDGQYSFSTENKHAVVGISFFPSTLHYERGFAEDYVRHIIGHEVQNEIRDVRKMLEFLEQQQSAHPEDVNLKRMIDIHMLKLVKLYNTLLSKHPATIERIVTDTTDAEHHVHEIFREEFDFCTRYLFRNLGESTTAPRMEKILKSMHARCSYEQPRKAATLKVINGPTLQSVYNVTRLCNRF